MQNATRALCGLHDWMNLLGRRKPESEHELELGLAFGLTAERDQLMSMGPSALLMTLADV